MDPGFARPRVSRLRFGIFELDARSGQLRRDGVNVRLPPQPFKVLWMLASRAGEVVTREEIRQELWGSDTFVDFDGGLNFCINQIRKALRDSAESPRFVHTLPRRGYQFVAAVEVVEDGGPPLRVLRPGDVLPAREPGPGGAEAGSGPALPDAGASRVEPAPLARPGRRIAVAAAGLALLLLLALAVALARRPGAEDVRYERVTFRRGVVQSARFSPSGEIVYSALWDSAPLNVYASQPGGADARTLGYEMSTLVSVIDANELGLVTMPAKGGSRVLSRAPAAGGARRDLREDVLFADWAGRDVAAAIVSRGGTQHLEFPMGRDVFNTRLQMRGLRVSRDGTLAAALEHPIPGDDRGHVVVFDRSGRRRVLSADWASLDGLAWSPRGDEVWFTGTRMGANTALHAVDLSGRERVLLRGPGRLVLHDVAPDGRVLLDRIDLRLEIRGLLPGGSHPRNLAWLDHSTLTGLTTDGSHVVLNESGEGGGQEYAAYFRRTDGSPAVRLGEGRSMGPSPDGQWVLTISVVGPPVVRAVPTGVGEARTLSHHLFDHAWAAWFPDSRRVLFAAAPRPGAPRQAYVQDMTGGPPRPVTPPGVGIRRGLVAPDGASFLVPMVDAGRRWKEYPVEGGEPRDVPGLEADDFPMAWSPDGRYLYVWKEKRVDRLDRRTGAREVWHEVSPPDADGRIRSGYITPDGRYYAYQYDRMLSQLYVVHGVR